MTMTPNEKTIKVPLHPGCGCLFLLWVIAAPVTLVYAIVHFIIKYW